MTAWSRRIDELEEENRQLRRVALRLYQYGNALMGDLRSPGVFGTQTPSIDATITGWMRVRGEYERLTSTSQDNKSQDDKSFKVNLWEFPCVKHQTPLKDCAECFESLTRTSQDNKSYPEFDPEKSK